MPLCVLAAPRLQLESQRNDINNVWFFFMGPKDPYRSPVLNSFKGFFPIRLVCSGGYRIVFGEKNHQIFWTIVALTRLVSLANNQKPKWLRRIFGFSKKNWFFLENSGEFQKFQKSSMQTNKACSWKISAFQLLSRRTPFLRKFNSEKVLNRSS
jgi:hypothetical protein